MRGVTFHDILVSIPWRRVALGARVIELAEGYRLQEVEGNLLLKRPNGYVLAAFTAEVDFDAIRRVAETDHKYLRAVDLEEKFGTAADAETVLLFAQDVRAARAEYLLALESAYRG
jgi:hypothetical protein